MTRSEIYIADIYENNCVNIENISFGSSPFPPDKSNEISKKWARIKKELGYKNSIPETPVIEKNQTAPKDTVSSNKKEQKVLKKTITPNYYKNDIFVQKLLTIKHTNNLNHIYDLKKGIPFQEIPNEHRYLLLHADLQSCRSTRNLVILHSANDFSLYRDQLTNCNFIVYLKHNIYIEAMLRDRKIYRNEYNCNEELHNYIKRHFDIVEVIDKFFSYDVAEFGYTSAVIRLLNRSDFNEETDFLRSNLDIKLNIIEEIILKEINTLKNHTNPSETLKKQIKALEQALEGEPKNLTKGEIYVAGICKENKKRFEDKKIAVKTKHIEENNRKKQLILENYYYNNNNNKRDSEDKPTPKKPAPKEPTFN